MKVTFRGWRREVYPHEVLVEPVTVDDDGYYRVEGESLKWLGNMTALGKFSNLGLSGDFLAEFQFAGAELQSWLTSYLLASPEDALRLIAAAQAEAIRHMSKQRSS